MSRKSRFNVLFSTIITADDVAKHKPAPDVYLQAADKLGVSFKDCIVFEDAPSGIKAAKNAGMKYIAVRTPYVDLSYLTEADLIVESLALVDMRVIDHIK